MSSFAEHVFLIFGISKKYFKHVPHNIWSLFDDQLLTQSFFLPLHVQKNMEMGHLNDVRIRMNATKAGVYSTIQQRLYADANRPSVETYPIDLETAKKTMPSISELQQLCDLYTAKIATFDNTPLTKMPLYLFLKKNLGDCILPEIDTSAFVKVISDMRKSVYPTKGKGFFDSMGTPTTPLSASERIPFYILLARTLEAIPRILHTMIDSEVSLYGAEANKSIEQVYETVLLNLDTFKDDTFLKPYRLCIDMYIQSIEFPFEEISMQMACKQKMNEWMEANVFHLFVFACAYPRISIQCEGMTLQTRHPWPKLRYYPFNNALGEELA
jgi:hypothetical protein